MDTYKKAVAEVAAAAQAWIDGNKNPDEITPASVAAALVILNEESN